MAEIDDNAHLKSGTGTHIFRLKGLQAKVFLNQNPNYAPYDTPPVNASYFMDISINSLLLDDLIFISAASNYIDNSKWPDISFSLGRINNSSKTDIDTYFVDHITKNIGPAWLAKNITGGYNNSDIFNNEDELVQQYVTMDKSISNLNYLKISPNDLSKKLALNKISILDITTNTPLTLYTPDASGADFVTPGWVTGYDPSYALTTSDDEYLLYDTLDQSGVFIKYGFHTQIGHAYKINIRSSYGNYSTMNTDVNVSIIDSNNNKLLYLHYDDLDENNLILDNSYNFDIADSVLKNQVYYSEPYTVLNNLYDSSYASINYTENIIAGQTQDATGWTNNQFENPEQVELPIGFAKNNTNNTFIITNVSFKNNLNLSAGNQSILFSIGDTHNDALGLYVEDSNTVPATNTTLRVGPSTGANAGVPTSIEISDNTSPSTIIVSVPENSASDVKIYQIINGSLNESSARVREDYFNDSDMLRVFDYITVGGMINSVADRRWKGTIGNIYRYETYLPTVSAVNNFLSDPELVDYSIDGSTNIVFYDNSIKSQLIKVLKRGGTSEANPLSGMNLGQYYGSKYNLGREIMLSMFASNDELTINRINNILTYQPPPIIYDVSLNTGYEGDNSGNLVFYLNGAETSILHLTRGLNYEFNINGVDISKNKFIFTKELKTDGVDICLNPVESNVITSGLTYEIDNNIVSFNDFYLNYESATTRKIKWLIPFNEVNVPINSFYGSDISDNLGGNIVINKNSIYGTMRFIAGDLIQFHLDYSQKSIVDASGVAIDGSGNKLGSNPIEEQDYIVRLHVHEFFNYPRFNEFINSYVLHHNLGPKNLNDSAIVGYDGNHNTAITSFLGNVSGTSFTLSVKFTINQIINVYDMIVGKWNGGSTGDYLFSMNAGTNFYWDYGILGAKNIPYDFQLGQSIIFTMIHNFTSKITTIYFNGELIDTINLASSISADGYFYDDFYIKDNVYSTYNKNLESAFIAHNILDISDISNLHNILGAAISNGHVENTLFQHTIWNSASIRYGFNTISNKEGEWKNWVTLDGSGIYLNNIASGNILGLQFATDSDEFGIGICSDVCDNILGPAEQIDYSNIWQLIYNGNNALVYNSETIDLTGYTGDTATGYQLLDSTYPQQQDYINFLTDINNNTDKSFTLIITNITSPAGYDVNTSPNGGRLGIITIGKRGVAADDDVYIYHNPAAPDGGMLKYGTNNRGSDQNLFPSHDISINTIPTTIIFSFNHNSNELKRWAIKNNTIIKETSLFRGLASPTLNVAYGVNLTNSEWQNGNRIGGSGWWTQIPERPVLERYYVYNRYIDELTDVFDNSKLGWPWEANKNPSDFIQSTKFLWAFDASLNGTDYKYKIADTSGVIEDYDDTKLHNQKYNWKIEINSNNKLSLKTSTDSNLNVESTYSNIQLDPNTQYYLWIGSKDPSFNFTNLKYLPETRVYDDEVTLGRALQTYSQGSTASYNSYNIVDQTEVTYNLSTADITYLVTHAGTPKDRIYINANRYSEAAPLELIVGNTYRFDLENYTNINTRLSFSSEPSGVGIIFSDSNYNFITYNGTPGVYDTSQGSRDRSPYVDVQITDNAPNKFYYYDASRNNSDISGTIIVNTSVINHYVTVVNTGLGNKYYINGSLVTPPLQLPVGRHRFIQSHSTNTSHPLKISTTSDGIHNSGIEYTDLVTYNGTPGTYDSYTELRIIDNIQNYYTYCANHSGMGFDILNSGYVASSSPHVINVTVAGGVFQLSSTVTLASTNTYIFIQSDSTNSGHPFRIITTADDNDYTTGVSYYGTPGQQGSYTELVVSDNLALSYKCQNHGGMGGSF